MSRAKSAEAAEKKLERACMSWARCEEEDPKLRTHPPPPASGRPAGGASRVALFECFDSSSASTSTPSVRHTKLLVSPDDNWQPRLEGVATSFFSACPALFARDRFWNHFL